MESGNNWEITENRFVVLFDILGFKDRVMRGRHEEIYKDLTEINVSQDILNDILNKQVVRDAFKDSAIDVVKFSDSIVLFSKNDTFENFILFLISSRYLFHSFFKKHFLVKGGMAHGKISIDKDKQLFFGQPIIDAHLLEEDVNYIGVIAHNSIDRFIQSVEKNNRFYSLLSQLIFEAKSPLKSGTITHYNLNWFPLIDNNSQNEKKENIKNDIITILKEYYLLVAGSPRRYIDNTIEFVDKNEIDFGKITFV